MTTQLDPKDQLSSVSDLALAAAVPSSGVPLRFAGSAWLTPDLALLFLRVAFGVSLSLAHGLGKLQGPALFLSVLSKRGFPLPVFFGWAAILSEFAGGLLLALGSFTRPAAALIVITLSVAALDIHSGQPFAKRELALAYAAVALTLLIAGPGRFSLDRRLWDSRTQPKRPGAALS